MPLVLSPYKLRFILIVTTQFYKIVFFSMFSCILSFDDMPLVTNSNDTIL